MNVMDKSTYKITKMDCPSEESLIRLKLADIEGIQNLEFDIPNRKLTVYHAGNTKTISVAIDQLNLNSKLVNSEIIKETEIAKTKIQRKILWTVLIINFVFFLIEITTGIISKSMGLVADSLDMFADAAVYGLSLAAVGTTIVFKKNVAKASGYVQIFLALLGFSEVIRRFVGIDVPPNFVTMIYVSIMALIANGYCLYLLQKTKSQEAHMKATMIFTGNDIIINLGVITAGILVNWSNSNKPDLIIGAIVFIIVSQGAFRILKIGK